MGRSIGYGFLGTGISGLFAYAFAANVQHWYGWIGVFFAAAFTLLIGSATAFQMWQTFRR